MISVKGRIHKGVIIKEIAQVERVQEIPKFCGACEALDYPHKCPNCGSKRVYLCPDGDEFIVCCLTKACRDENVTESKRIAREEANKERNRYGDLMSGAEKFNMGARYKNAHFMKLTAPEYVQKNVMSWVNDGDKSLIYTGNTGCGKTYLCACALNHLFELKKEAYYITHRRLVSQMQQAIQDNREAYEVIRKLSYQRYLILDDIGSAANTDWQKEMLLELIDIRYNKQLPTMYTSNLNFEDMKKTMGDRIVSRLFDKDNIKIESWSPDRRTA